MYDIESQALTDACRALKVAVGLDAPVDVIVDKTTSSNAILFITRISLTRYILLAVMSWALLACQESFHPNEVAGGAVGLRRRT